MDGQLRDIRSLLITRYIGGLVWLFIVVFGGMVRGEVILQYFNTSWPEITRRMPELAEAGYSALWLPPPFKAGAGIWSVGFDPFDRFDYGSKDQMGTIPTKYGTAEELRELIKVAHRFGLRVYFDNVMAHNGGPIPGYDEHTPITVQPGFYPEDFHLKVRPDGTYRKMGDSVDYTDEIQCLYRNEFGLDIAHEDPNGSFGYNEYDSFPKYYGVRHPDNPEYYLDTDLPIATDYWGQAVFTFANKEPFDDIGYGDGHVGAGNGRFDWDDSNGNGQHDVGEVSEPYADTGIDPSMSWRCSAHWGYGDGRYNMGNPCSEDVNTMLFRAVRWFVDQCYVDGFRLDAVKHVPHYYFGQDWGDKDASSAGYCGQIQEQFNLTHGYSDWNNHRDTVYNTDAARDDAMLYGEHVGDEAHWTYKRANYMETGMRIGDNDLISALNGGVSGWGDLTGHDQPGHATLGVDTAVMYAGSHDKNDIYYSDRPLAHALILTRAGLPIIYTDGYHHSGPPDYFPKWADNAFLGQFGDQHLLNLLHINQLFARGEQQGKWGDRDYVAFERLDWRETGDQGNAVILACMMARNGCEGASRSWNTSFAEGARLRNYSCHGGGFYVNVQDGQIKNDEGYNPTISSGKWFAFSWRIPEMPSVWGDGITSEVKPITILENGQPVGVVMQTRTDGSDGDANYNPHGLPDSHSDDYSYQMPVPRITSCSNLSFLVRADGSAHHVMLKLDGGMDLNSHMGLGPQEGDRRDHPPAVSYDMFLGYEDMQPVYRIAEKFAAQDVARNVIGSPGAETYVCTIGSSGFAVNQGGGLNMGMEHAVTWAYHDPGMDTEWSVPQFSPVPEQAADTNVTVWVKIGYNGQPDRVFLYYTTDGESWPEGSGGLGKGSTRVAELGFDRTGTSDGTGDPDWWKVSLPPLAAGTELRYKIGVCKDDAPDVFPFSGADHARITPMETLYAITNYNAGTTAYQPHNNYGITVTGLEEGYHILRSKAFLNRGGAASIYNLEAQTFYCDLQPPQGAIQYPANDYDTLYGSYGVVVQGDRSITEVWYRITDVDPDNDDAQTGLVNGNGEWAKAVEENVRENLTGPFPRRWRFEYINVPSLGTARIEVRLCEVSSSTNLALSDADGHFTTLERVVYTRGPDYQLYIQWPGTDGDRVGPGYVLKAAFSKALGDGLSESDLINCFTLTIDTNLQDRSACSINWDVTADRHELAVPLPNLYDGRPDYLHEIVVDYHRDGYPDLQAVRRVRAEPIVVPYMAFITPPGCDELGRPYRLCLPDTVNPVATQRQYLVQVETATNAELMSLVFEQGSGVLTERSGNPVASNNMSQWFFQWDFPLTNNPAILEGRYRLMAQIDTDGDTNTVEAYASRVVDVVVRELVNVSTNDTDDDDDGIPDFNEENTKSLPESDPSEWNNGDVHCWYIYGHTAADCPDTDGDGLPDGLESGWRGPLDNTETNVDTDGDGFMNFISDLDPPFYNTCDNYQRVPGVSECQFGSKMDLKGGTVTDPNNADSDYDGLPDGLEDANRNGWVDGDGQLLMPDWEPWLERDWPNGKMEVSETWLETSPGVADSDGDGLSDGFGEDRDADGRIEGDSNTNRVYDAGEGWSETNPLDKDTDNDGLPDGWETWFELDPLDDGVESMRGSAVGDGLEENGPDGDPDGDGFSNLSELISGTNPRWFDSGVPVPAGDIVIGPRTSVVVGCVENLQELTDWTREHLLALDRCDALQEASNGGDVYHRPWASDGFESSRDLVAFYAHDGGALGDGGDGRFYFRVDMHDLQPHAEDNGLDIYVVIDTGNIGIGERKVLDDVDVLTDMRWEVIVKVDDWSDNLVYVNTPGSWDTDTIDDMMRFGDTEVQVRTMAHAHGFDAVYFNAELDACEFSIRRQALLDAGWNGNIAQLNFQVFTTRDHIGNDPVGDGDLDGPDIQDCIRTDWIAEDFAGIKGEEHVVNQKRYDARIELTTLVQWVGWNADNDRGKCIKVVPLIHGSEPLMPGHFVQQQVNNGEGAGYYRPLDTHQAYALPVTMHITPVLASAIEWAKSDGDPLWKDGPTLNHTISRLVASNLVQLTGSTFADHMLPYFTPAFNQGNVALAAEFLRTLYGPGAVSSRVFWAPERLLDADVLSKIVQMGYEYTFMDQMQHVRRWFSFNEAINDNAYRINRINNVGCFIINDLLHSCRFQTHDHGPVMSVRELLNRRVLSGEWSSQHPQVFTVQMDWGEFCDKNNADAYDTLIRWMASRGWIEFVTPDQIVRGDVDISLPPDGVGDDWNQVDRGNGIALSKTGHDWIQYSAQYDYDNWYIGSDLNEGLMNYTFNIRPGVPVPDVYGMLYYGGMVSSAWCRVSSMNSSTSELACLARATLYASTFKTAYHSQSQHPVNMAKFAIGDFAHPDSSWDGLTDQSRNAQSQTRLASLYDCVDQWAYVYPSNTTRTAQDVDLDGEDEYLLMNERLFCVFESIGGRMTAAWVRNPVDGNIVQVVGNLISYAGTDTEEQGVFCVDGDGQLGAYRMGCFVDWWGTRGEGTSQYVNDLYSFSEVENGWEITSSDGCIQRQVVLLPRVSVLNATYTLLNDMAGQILYVRHGLSPNLYDLLLHGQSVLGDELHEQGVMSLCQSNYTEWVEVRVGYSDDGHTAGFNRDAVDDNPGAGHDFDTVPMRNLPQTHQVELVGTNVFSFSLGFDVRASDWDQDGIPNVVEDAYPFLSPQDGTDAHNDLDGDGISNYEEYIAGTLLDSDQSCPQLQNIERRVSSGVRLRFATETGRNHYIWYMDEGLINPSWTLATTNPIRGTGGVVEWIDDGSLTSPDPASGFVTSRFYHVEYRVWPD